MSTSSGSPPRGQNEHFLTVDAGDLGTRKRARDAVTDAPTPTESSEDRPASASSPHAKRNRLQSRTTPPPDTELDTSPQSNTPDTSHPYTEQGQEQEQENSPSTPTLAATEVENVKNIRHQVRDMSTAEAANKLSQEDLVALGESAASKGVEPQEALPIPEDTLTPKHTSAPPPISTSNAPASNPMSASNGPSPAPKSPFATFSSAASPFSNVPGSSTSAFGAAPVVSPASFEPLPVSKPNLQALQMQGPPAAPTSDEQAEKVTPHTKSLLSHFKRPPSPASSIMAETGSTYEPSHTRRSSLSSTTSHATEDTKPTSTDDTSKATAPSPRKPALSGFTSQASAASPFARAGAAASDSPFAHKPATAPSKPSSLGGFSGFSSPFSKATAPTATASSSAASASPFAKMASSPGLKPTHPTDQSVASAQEDADKAGSSNHKDFGTMLKDSGAAAASVPPAVSNEKIEFKELDEVITGEECENTRFSSRCKLFVMEGDGYREAGLGALRINQNTSSNKPSYRLLMRAEATHRLLINAPLFKKMVCQIVESKFVRISAIVDGHNKTYLVKCSNQDVAKSLSDTIMDALSQLDGAEDSTPGAGGGAEAEAV